MNAGYNPEDLSIEYINSLLKGECQLSFRRNRNCGCNKPKQICYPVKQNTVNCCTEEVVQHIHPTHTTFKHNHLIKNQHMYPETYSHVDSVNSINQQMPPQQPTQVSPAMSGPNQGMGPNSNMGMGPNMGGGPNMGMGPYGMGNPYGQMHSNCKPKTNHCHKNKWC